jgi:hypothetical protein
MLDAALPICINKHHQTPMQVEMRRDDGIKHLRVDRVISEMSQGKKKILAPRTPRPKIAQVMEMSLLR